MNPIHDPYLPQSVYIKERRQDATTIFTLDLCFSAQDHHQKFYFKPGQFNMLYLFGVGEVPISIASDPKNHQHLSHTIRVVGRVTKALSKLQAGDELGLRGPYGRGWPLKDAENKDIVIVTGGLGCAPVVSVINYIIARRERFGKLYILQGVKHSDDFIFRKQYQIWEKIPDTHVYIAADQAGPQWPWKSGFITDVIQTIPFKPENTLAMMCGPEGMMHTAVTHLFNKGLPEDQMYLSMERNMRCGIGHCGHCQYGAKFICKDGPVFPYHTIKALFSEKGF